MKRRCNSIEVGEANLGGVLRLEKESGTNQESETREYCVIDAALIARGGYI